MGVSGEAPRPRSGPDGFQVVSVPGEESAPERTEAPEPEPEEAPTESTPEPPEPDPEPAEQPEASRPDPEARAEPADSPSDPVPGTKSPDGLVKRRTAPEEPRRTEEPDRERVARAPEAEPEPEAEQPEPARPEDAAGEAGERAAEPAEQEPEPEEETETSSGAGRYQPPSTHSGYKSNPPPSYPLRARRRGLEGTVLLQVRVSPEGEPVAVRVDESSGHGILDRTARETVRDWAFEPARRGGRAVEGTVRVPVRFRLSEG
ncbi:hypothetical protein AN478_12070 [Thiohalorhabdus denitrificans]|nr:hypothetical protein AN478_12070 [Thiohalorhabdus denitrificans]